MYQVWKAICAESAFCEGLLKVLKYMYSLGDVFSECLIAIDMCTSNNSCDIKLYPKSIGSSLNLIFNTQLDSIYEPYSCDSSFRN
jgi:hypothetical protein